MCLSKRFSKIGSAARFAVPEKIIGLTLFLDFFDRCTALGSLLPPLAALPSLTQRATLVVRIPRMAAAKHAAITKKEHHPDGWCSFLVAEAGLEPTTSGL